MSSWSYVHRLASAGTTVDVVGDSEFGSNHALTGKLGLVLCSAPERQPSALFSEPAVLAMLRHLGHGPGSRTVTGKGRVNLKAWLPDLFPGHLGKRGRKGPLGCWPPTWTCPRKPNAPIDALFHDHSTRSWFVKNSFRAPSYLTMALLYVWLVAFGFWTIKNGPYRLVDRSDRRDPSTYHIDFDMLDGCLANDEGVSLGMIPNFA